MICLKAVSTVYKTKMNIALNTLVESQVASFVFGAQLASLSFGCFNYSVVNNLTMTLNCFQSFCSLNWDCGKRSLSISKNANQQTIN